MLWLWLVASLLFRARTEDCANVRPKSAATIRPPRSPTLLADVVGLESVKDLLREAVVLPLSSQGDVLHQLFRRSEALSAVLLAGPSGLGKSAAIEAAAATAGANVIVVLATEIANGDFCGTALASANGTEGRPGRPVVVLVESLESAAVAAARAIRQCLWKIRGAGGRGDSEASPRVVITATMGVQLRRLGGSERESFGYVLEVGLPTQTERRQFLDRLITQVSKIEPTWASALPEAAPETLANLTENMTFSEIDFLFRRAFSRSATEAGGKLAPVALHHFEQILAEMDPALLAASVVVGAHREAYSSEVSVEDSSSSATSSSSISEVAIGPEEKSESDKKKKKKKSKESKDPMEGMFGWCNAWLPESLQLPPVMWAMVVFAILAHFMARSTYQPHNNRKRGGAAGAAGGAEGRSSLFGDMGRGGGGSAERSSSYPNFGNFESGGSPFGSFPPPPSMPGGEMDGGSSGSGAPPFGR